MTGIIAVTVIVILLVAISALVAAAAPQGYEDENGFHEGER
jgi:hypothetical protein